MPTQPGLLDQFAQRFSSYLPTLVAGLLVLLLGLAAGWVAKQAVVRVLVWLRLDRLGARVGWRAAFEKGDVRAALYNVIGTVAMLMVVLVFLDNAFQIWGLDVLSRVIDRLARYVPNLGLVALIAGVGSLLASVAGSRLEAALAEEDIAHPRLLGKALKAVILAVVAAIALWQLDLARQIVLSGFVVAFGALGVAFALAVGLGSARAIQGGWERLFRRGKDE